MKNTVRVERARHRITQEELAKKVKSSRQTIHLIETEQVNPKVGVVIRIARFFGMEVEELFKSDDDE